MGKNKKKTQQQKQQQQQSKQEATDSREVSNDASNNKNVAQKKQEDVASESTAQSTQVEEKKTTPEERANEYKQTQMQVYNTFLAEFEDDLDVLNKEANFAEKERELEKIRKDELKKCEKLIKRDMNEWEEQFAGNASLSKNAKGVGQLGDKIIKLMENNLRKQLKKGLQSEENRLEAHSNRDKVEASLNQNVKVRKTLEILCQAFFTKNHALYLKHETMLDDEKQKRQELALVFQGKMEKITAEINSKREERQSTFQKEIDENTAIRKKITDQIADYKAKEEKYQAEMSAHQKKMEGVEKDFKAILENKIGSAIKDAEKEKANYEKSCKNVMEISDQIQAIVGKFDKLKETITESSQKFQNAQVEVETKRMENKLLETQIQNISLRVQKREKVQAVIHEERSRLEKQLQTMQGLASALETQLKNA